MSWPQLVALMTDYYAEGENGLPDWCFARLEAHPCLKPLPVRFHEADQGHRCIAKPCGQAHDVIEPDFWSGVQDAKGVQRIKAIAFIHNQTCIQDDFLTKHGVSATAT